MIAVQFILIGICGNLWMSGDDSFEMSFYDKTLTTQKNYILTVPSKKQPDKGTKPIIFD